MVGNMKITFSTAINLQLSLAESKHPKMKSLPTLQEIMMVAKGMTKKILKMVKLMVSRQMGSRTILSLGKGLQLSENIKMIIILQILREMMILPSGKLSPFTNYVFIVSLEELPSAPLPKGVT